MVSHELKRAAKRHRDYVEFVENTRIAVACFPRKTARGVARQKRQNPGGGDARGKRLCISLFFRLITSRCTFFLDTGISEGISFTPSTSLITLRIISFTLSTSCCTARENLRQRFYRHCFQHDSVYEPQSVA